MIPVSDVLLDPEDHRLVAECLASGRISSSSPYVERFEAAWAARCGVHHGVAVNSGTSALHVALAALGIGPGDEVILPSFTIISCAVAVIAQGATPVLVDCDAATWCMDTTLVEAALTARTRAIMPVHIYGHPVDLDPLLDLAERHGVAIVEDAAEAHGAEYLSSPGAPEPRWRTCGGIGTVGAFSFYANKAITTGEGGMVVTDDEAIAAAVREYSNLGFRPGRRFLHTQLGASLRMSGLQAALGLGQVGRLGEIVARKRRIARAYAERLATIDGLQSPVERPWARNAYWMYGIVLDEAWQIDAAELLRRLSERGVEARPFFWGLHEQPALRERGLFARDRHPTTERIARRGLYLPSGLTLSIEQIDRVCAALRSSLHSTAST